MASTAYSRDYRDWIAGRRNFERVCERGREDVAGVINFQRPDPWGRPCAILRLPTIFVGWSTLGSTARPRVA